MPRVPHTNEEILASKTSRALPRPVEYPQASIAEYHQAVDNFNRVFAIRPGEHVVMLTDPLLDPRVLQAVYGICRARGATFGSYMGRSTQYERIPDEAKPMLEQANFVVSTWFASVVDPYAMALRRKGQRWVKITFFRNLDLLHTPHARFPIELVGEIIRANARAYPTNGEFDLKLTDDRGTNFEINFTQDMRKNLLETNRWRGQNTADQDGCYVHYLATHGPNIYDPTALGVDSEHKRGPVNGVVYPQWGTGFEKPFMEKVGVEFKDDTVIKVHGKSAEADILRDMLIGGRLEELGCGHNPKAPRFDIYPAGPNSPGALHFGINALKPSDYVRRMLPNWEEPPIHMDLVTFDSTVTAGNNTLIEQGYLTALRDPSVVKAAEKYGDPVDLLENFPV